MLLSSYHSVRYGRTEYSILENGEIAQGYANKAVITVSLGYSVPYAVISFLSIAMLAYSLLSVRIFHYLRYLRGSTTFYAKLRLEACLNLTPLFFHSVLKGMICDRDTKKNTIFPSMYSFLIIAEYCRKSHVGSFRP